MISFLTFLIGFILSLGAFIILKSKSTNSPPGPWTSAIPIFGSLFSLTVGPYHTFIKWAKLYGPIVQTKLGSATVLILDDFETIKEAFSEPVFSGKPDNRFFKEFSDGNNGVIATQGQEWIEQRRFVLRNLRDFGFGKRSLSPLIMEEVNDVIDWIKKNEGKPVAVNRKLNFATVNALWTITSGKRFETDDPKLTEIMDALIKAFDETGGGGVLFFFPEILRIFPNFLKKLQRAMQPVKDYINETILEHKADHCDDAHPRDLIDVYLTEMNKCKGDLQSSFSGEAGERHLKAIVADVFHAGSGTTAATITWSILYLMKFPEVQRKLQAELDFVVGSNRQPTLEDRIKTPYADAVVQEIFRFSALVPLGFRNTMNNTKFRGYDIRKDTWVVANLYSVHFNKDTWGDPEKFRPERFLSPDGKTVIGKDKIIPFSIGKRVCLAETMARDSIYLFLTNILHRFDVTPDPSNPNPSISPVTGVLHEAQPFQAVFKDRL